MIEAVLDSLNIAGRVILILNGSHIDNNEYIQAELQNFNHKYNDILMIKSYEKLE